MTIQSSKKKLDKFIETRKELKISNNKNIRRLISPFMTMYGLKYDYCFRYIDDSRLLKDTYLGEVEIYILYKQDEIISNQDKQRYAIEMSRCVNSNLDVFIVTNGFQYSIYTVKNNRFELHYSFDILNLSENDYSKLLNSINLGIEYILFDGTFENLEDFKDNVWDLKHGVDMVTNSRNTLNVSILPTFLFEKSLSKLIKYKWTQWNNKHIKPNKEYKCELCGCDMSDNKRLYHGHERYTVDHDNKIIIIEEVKHLCHRCHYTYHTHYVLVALSEEEQDKQLKHLQVLDSSFGEYDEYLDLTFDTTRVRYDVRIIKDNVYYDIYSVSIMKADKYVSNLSDNKYTLNDLFNVDLSDYSYSVKGLEHFEVLEQGLIKAGINIV